MFADDKYGHDGRHHLVIIRTNFFVCVGGSNGVIIPSTSETRGWRDGLWLKAVTALVEDPDSVPSTHVTVHYTHHSSFGGGGLIRFLASGYHMHVVHTQTYMRADAHKQIK